MKNNYSCGLKSLVILLISASINTCNALEIELTYNLVHLSGESADTGMGFRLTLTSYLKNESKEAVKVATRNPLWTEEIYSLYNIWLSIKHQTTPKNQVIEVPESDYGVVVLNPGQVTCLGKLVYLTDTKIELEELQQVRVNYRVDPIIAKQINVWSGEIRSSGPFSEKELIEGNQRKEKCK